MWPVRPAELLDAGKHVHERLAWRRNLEKRVTLRRHFAQPAANKQDEIGTLHTCEKLGISSDAEVAGATGMRGADAVGTTERGCDRQRETIGEARDRGACRDGPTATARPLYPT